MNEQGEGPPERVIGGRYRVGALIGQGSMGTVYQAQHTLTRRDVALKLIQHGASNPALVKARFEREISVSANVDHDGIVRVFDGGEEPDGTLYLAMELLRGQTLQQRSAQSEFTPHYGFQVVMGMLEALAAAHAAGIVHRDVKPENIFLHRHPDGQEQVKLVDFGIAKSPMQQSNTRTDVGLGTPYYMSPEQATSARDVTPAADVWSVGVILYWLLSGRLPFNGETPFATLTQVCTADLPPLDVHEGQTNRDLVALTQAMLCKDPGRRPQNAGVLLEALHQILGTGTSETSQSRLRFTSSLNLQRAWSTQGTIAPKMAAPSPINYDAPPAESPMASSTLAASLSTAAPVQKRRTRPYLVGLILLLIAMGAGGIYVLQDDGAVPHRPRVQIEPEPLKAAAKPPLPVPVVSAPLPAPAIVAPAKPAKPGADGARRRRPRARVRSNPARRSPVPRIRASETPVAVETTAPELEVAASPTVAEPEAPEAVPQPTEPAVSAKPDEPIEAKPITVEPAVVPDEAEAPAKAAAKPQKKNAKKKEQPFLTF